MCLSFAVTVT